MRLRQVTLEDARQLTTLLKEIGWFDVFKEQSLEEATRQVVARLTECLADNSHSLYVAEADEGVIMGYVSVHWLPYLFMRGPEGYVSELFVRPGADGRGLGHKLLEHVLEEAKKRGGTRLSLVNLRSRESYRRQFYVKAGWRERAEAANFIFQLPPPQAEPAHS